MMNSKPDTTVRMAQTLYDAVDAAHVAAYPNGTTKKLRTRMDSILRKALDEIYETAANPEVPNGTTKKVLRIMEHG